MILKKADILDYYKTNDVKKFVHAGVKNHPLGFCDMAYDEGFEFMEHKDDIINFYGNSTYNKLLSHLKTIGSNSIEVQAFVLDELHIYGSSRLGILKVNMNLVEFDAEGLMEFEAIVNTEYMHRDLGNKRYELSNHLGNVLVTVTDKKVYVEDAGDVAYFEPENTSISDYYPFGSVISKRSYSSGEYRFGFNGKEIDNAEEGMGGGGSTYDYGFRIYNSNLGRFLSVDPLYKDYSYYTPYHFAGNLVIAAIDLDGLEEFIVIIRPHPTIPEIEVVNVYKVAESSRTLQEGFGNGGVEYRKYDAAGNVVSGESGRQTDFTPNSVESYYMNQDVNYFESSDAEGDVKTAKRREVMIPSNLDEQGNPKPMTPTDRSGSRPPEANKFIRQNERMVGAKLFSMNVAVYFKTDKTTFDNNGLIDYSDSRDKVDRAIDAVKKGGWLRQNFKIVVQGGHDIRKSKYKKGCGNKCLAEDRAKSVAKEFKKVLPANTTIESTGSSPTSNEVKDSDRDAKVFIVPKR